MGITEIVLLVIGGLFFVISFFLPEGKKEEKITEEQIKALVDKELENARGKIDDMVDETVNYAVEKTERAIEKIANEKILAVDEYSETVLKKINDNHQEAVFLYDMLNDKDEKIKSTKDEISAGVELVESAKKEIEETKLEIAKEKELIGQKIEEASFEPFSYGNVEIVKVSEDGTSVLEADTHPYSKSSDDTVSSKAKVGNETVSNASTVTKTAKSTGGKSKSGSTSSGKSKAANSSSKAKQAIPVHIETGSEGRRNSNELIRKLHEEGKSNTQIARELNLGVGEVKLVIDLFANRK